MAERKATRNGRIAMLGAGLAWSTAGLGQHALDATPATDVAGRALFAFLTLLVIVLLTEGPKALSSLRSLGFDGIVLALCLAISSGTFMLALNYTTVANVLFFMAAAPFLAAVLGRVILSDRISRRTGAAMGIAAAGVAIMVVGSLDAGVLTVFLPILMTATFAVVIVITRYRREVSMMPATCLSQGLIVVVVGPFASFGSATASDWRIFVVLGVLQMGFGLTLLTIGARALPPAEVALLAMIEVVLGPLWVWLAYAEQPATATLVGGTVVSVAVIVQATAREDSGQIEPERAVPAASPD